MRAFVTIIFISPILFTSTRNEQESEIRNQEYTTARRKQQFPEDWGFRS
jgi:hypothetical protein